MKRQDLSGSPQGATFIGTRGKKVLHNVKEKKSTMTSEVLVFKSASIYIHIMLWLTSCFP